MGIWATIFTIFLLSLVKVSKVETKIKLSPKNFKISQLNILYKTAFGSL